MAKTKYKESEERANSGKSNKSSDYSSIQSDKDDPCVVEMLELISGNNVTHNKHQRIWRIIQQLFESGFDVYSVDGSKVISSKVLLQILWRAVNKLKIPDFKIYRAGPFASYRDKEKREVEEQKRDWYQQAVTAGVATVMKEGGFIQCMTGKGGAFYKGGLFGDVHIDVGFNEDNSDYPISFRVGSLSDTYLDNSCTDIVDPVGGNSAEGKVTIYRYKQKQFDILWPAFAGKVQKGAIPREMSSEKQLEKTTLQSSQESEDVIEVAYYQSIAGKEVVAAGASCTILRKREGKPIVEKEKKEKPMMPEGAEMMSIDGEGFEIPIMPESEQMDEAEDTFQEPDKKGYPYYMDGKPYLSMLHFIFFPSSEGYYNYGIGHMVFDIACVMARMDNMAYKHAGKNINPINLVNSSSKNTSKLFRDILKAREATELGEEGFVVSNNPAGGSGVTVESFQSQPITTEWERAFGRLETQINRMGFNLDGTDLGSSPNEMSIMSAEESQDAPMKQIIEFNAVPFFQRAVDITMDFIRKFVPDDDMTPLNSTVDIETGSEKIPMRSVPLGWIAKELRKNKYFTVVNSRDGTIPSNVMELARARQTMQTLAPGTPAWAKMSLKIAQLNGHSLSMEDLGQQTMPGQGAEAPEELPPTETSNLSAYDLKHGQK